MQLMEEAHTESTSITGLGKGHLPSKGNSGEEYKMQKHGYGQREVLSEARRTKEDQW